MNRRYDPPFDLDDDKAASLIGWVCFGCFGLGVAAGVAVHVVYAAVVGC